MLCFYIPRSVVNSDFTRFSLMYLYSVHLAIPINRAAVAGLYLPDGRILSGVFTTFAICRLFLLLPIRLHAQASV